jgi:predicted enzyme related to lactoylglutathione lyase
MQDFEAGGLVLPVHDLEAALRLYRDTLGWRLRFQDGDRYAALDTESGSGSGGRAARLALATASEQPVGGSPALLVKVKDVTQAIAALTQVGAMVVAPVAIGSHEIRAAVEDPDGNVISVYSTLPKEPTREATDD